MKYTIKYKEGADETVYIETDNGIGFREYLNWVSFRAGFNSDVYVTSDYAYEWSVSGEGDVARERVSLEEAEAIARYRGFRASLAQEVFGAT